MPDFPREAYHETPESRTRPRIVDAPEYGFGGAAYARARQFAGQEAKALEWHEENSGQQPVPANARIEP